MPLYFIQAQDPSLYPTNPDYEFPKIKGEVFASLSDENGGWYIGGSFSHVGGKQVLNLVHILSDLSVDPSFRPEPDDTVRALKLYDGSLYVGGAFKHIDEQARSFIARIDPQTGDLHGVSLASPDSTVYALAVDGESLYLGGAFQAINGNDNHSYFASLDLETGRPRMGSDLNVPVYAITQDENAIYLGGSFSRAYTQESNIKIYWQYGEYPLAEFPHVSGKVYTAISDGQGGWYLGGQFSSVGGVPVQNLAHVNTDLSVDTGFNPDPDGSVKTLFLYEDTLYVYGDFSHLKGQAIANLGRKSTADATPDPQWTPTLHYLEPYLDILVDEDNVYLAGHFDSVNGNPQDNFAVLTREHATHLPTGGSEVPVKQIVHTSRYIFVNRPTAPIKNDLMIISKGDWTINVDPSLQPEQGNIRDMVVFRGLYGPDFDVVYMAGNFSKLAGEQRFGLGAIEVEGPYLSAFWWQPYMTQGLGCTEWWTSEKIEIIEDGDRLVATYGEYHCLYPPEDFRAWPSRSSRDTISDVGWYINDIPLPDIMAVSNERIILVDSQASKTIKK